MAFTVSDLDQLFAELIETDRRMDERFARVERMLDKIDGRFLEQQYRQEAGAYFGPWLRRCEVVDFQGLWDEWGPRLTEEELRDALRVDLLVRGRLRKQPEKDAWLAIEVSAVVDREDVTRAARRAGLIRRAGMPAVPVAAGENATLGADEEAQRLGVAIVQDGSSRHWDLALAAWPV